MNDSPDNDFTDDIVSLLIGRIAVENELISEKILLECKRIQQNYAEKGSLVTLDEILVENGHISIEMMGKLVATAARNLDKRIGSLAVKKSFATFDDVEKALAFQASEFKKGRLVLVGDFLVDNNIITELQREILLEDQLILKQDEKKQIDKARKKNPIQSKKSSGFDASAVAQEPEILVSDDALIAEAFIPENYSSKNPVKDLLSLAYKKGIKYGLIDPADIESNLDNNHLKFIIAKGVPPENGKDGRIEYYFDRNYLNPGKLSEEGFIDFRDRGNVPFVNSGSLIARLFPPVEGHEGKTVFGQVIPPEKVEEAGFILGPGVKLNAAKDSLFSTIEGQPVVNASGEVSVLDEFKIKGDVDYNTGNIVFSGSVIVSGSVKAGFEVKSGTLTVKELTGAKIETKGNVEVSGGVINSEINAGGSVQALYVTASKIHSHGGIYLKKEMIDTEAYTDGEFSSDTLNVISSKISAAKGVNVKSVGTDISEPCSIKVGFPENSAMKIDEKKKKLGLLKDDLEKLHTKYLSKEKKLSAKQEQITLAGNLQEENIKQRKKIEDLILSMGDNNSLVINGKNLNKSVLKISLEELDNVIKLTDESLELTFEEQDAQTDEMLDLKDKVEECVEKIEILNTRIRNLTQWTKEIETVAELKVKNEIFPGTIVKGRASKRIIKEIMKNSHFKEKRINIDGEVKWSMVLSEK